MNKNYTNSLKGQSSLHTPPFQKMSAPLQKAAVLDEIRSCRSACTLSTICTIVLITGSAIFTGIQYHIFHCWLIVLCGIPLICLCMLFSRACAMAGREIVKMPDSFCQNRARTLTPSEMAVRLINNNAQLLSDRFCLLDEDERAELEQDRRYYPTPENTPDLQQSSDSQIE